MRVGCGWAMHFLGGKSVLTKFHVQHGFHVHGGFLSIGLDFVVVSRTVVPFEVVIGIVVASVAFWTLGGFVTPFFAK